MLKAYKRFTVEFFHEVDGKIKAEEIDFVQEFEQRPVGYSRDAFDSHLVDVLKEMGIVNPRIAGIYKRLNEPPMFAI